jgi:hypothetical protein
MKKTSRSASLIALGISLALLAGCGDVKKEASYPTGQTAGKSIYSDKPADTIWGEGQTLGSRLLGKDQEDNTGSSGIGVNSFLWRASLDTISFMPVASADPFGGVILTEWYENPKTPGERFKLSVYILDKQLRADGVRVAAFKQVQGKGGWKDSAVGSDMATNIENTILTRARELRVAQAGRGKL